MWGKFHSIARQVRVMNAQRRRPTNAPTNNQSSLQYVGLIGFVFCAFLMWLWLYSPGTSEPARSLASAEVLEWLEVNGLQRIEMDPKISGELKKIVTTRHNLYTVRTYTKQGLVDSMPLREGITVDTSRSSTSKLHVWKKYNVPYFWGSC